MDLLQQIVARAKADKQRIVLPEAEEERTFSSVTLPTLRTLQHSGVLITSTRLLLLIQKTILRLRSMQRSSPNFARRRA